MFLLFAGLSALCMGLFYVLDMFFESRGVYTRPSQAMIVSSIVPLLSVPFFILTPWWQPLPLPLMAMAFLSGAFLIWANWFYFLVMFPVDKDNKEVEAVDGATELALYEGTTPALVLILSLVLSQYVIYTDTISTWQGIAVIWTVAGLVLYATADGFAGFTKWSYRIKLTVFALLVAVSQLIQDLAVNYAQINLGASTLDAYFSVSPWVWLGMFSGIVIVFWKREWHYFVVQWKEKIQSYAGIILIAEIIALGAYALLIASYVGEHVAVSGAIAVSFPVIVFLGGLLLQVFDIQKGKELASTTHILKKLLFIALTLAGVVGVIML